MGSLSTLLYIQPPCDLKNDAILYEIASSCMFLFCFLCFCFVLFCYVFSFLTCTLTDFMKIVAKPALAKSNIKQKVC